MNIAKIMIPKISTVFLHEKDTIRQGLERFMVHGYTAVPVLNDQEQYIESVTEGDFLRHLLVCQTDSYPTRPKANRSLLNQPIIPFILIKYFRNPICPHRSDFGLQRSIIVA